MLIQSFLYCHWKNLQIQLDDIKQVARIQWIRDPTFPKSNFIQVLQHYQIIYEKNFIKMIRGEKDNVKSTDPFFQNLFSFRSFRQKFHMIPLFVFHRSNISDINFV